MGIEAAVHVPVRGFLADEALHLVGEVRLLIGRQRGQPLLHRLDEQLLTQREAHAQRIEESGAEGVTGPVARQRGVQVRLQAAHSQGRHGDKYRAGGVALQRQARCGT